MAEKRAMSEDEKRREIYFMQFPSLWPMVVFCGVKKPQREGFPLTGVLSLGKLVGDPVEPVVYEYPRWVWEAGADRSAPLVEMARYTSFEEMVDDGWVVD